MRRRRSRRDEATGCEWVARMTREALELQRSVSDVILSINRLLTYPRQCGLARGGIRLGPRDAH